MEVYACVCEFGDDICVNEKRSGKWWQFVVCECMRNPTKTLNLLCK